MCGDEKGLKIRHYSGKVTDLERREVGHPWRVHKAVSARLLVRQQLESTHEVLSRNQWRSVRPKHLSRYSLLKERATSPPVKKILTVSENPARTQTRRNHRVIKERMSSLKNQVPEAAPSHKGDHQLFLRRDRDYGQLLKKRTAFLTVKKILTATGNPARNRQSTTIE